ncbi:MAG: membrane protein insertase YidC [Bacilli bacterium]|nr:membrane protein insertase YidC [Bacilli bacterium]
MTKKSINKLTLLTAAGLGAVVLLASCTANFCTPKDRSRILYTYDTGTLRFTTKQDESPECEILIIDGETAGGSTPIYYYQNPDYAEKVNDKYPKDYIEDDSKTLTDVITAASSAGIICPSDEYWERMDLRTVDGAYTAWSKALKDDKDPSTNPIPISSLTLSDIIGEKDKETEVLTKRGFLADYGYVKFSENDDMWTNWDKWTDELRKEPGEGGLGVNACPSPDFTALYKSYLQGKVNNARSFITIGNGGIFGNFGYNHNKILMEGISWGDAWHHGLIEGLLVWPIAALTEKLSAVFGMNGIGQLGAILLVTFIVRTFLLLVSFKTTLGQQKMQMLQPEMAKIQAKYPNANTNQAQKQRMSQEQMALYKKNKINPIGSLLVLIVQFPIFIGVWGAMQGSAALASDKVGNLYLSDSIWTTLSQNPALPTNDAGFWTAFILIIVMSVSQFVSMKLPQWMQKHRDKKHPQPKLTANPAGDKTQKQMKWFGYIMLVFIIIMGFTLPAGMGVYWLAGALFSIVQTVVFQFAMHGTFKRQGIAIKRLFTVKIPGLFKKKDPSQPETIDVDTSKKDGE